MKWHRQLILSCLLGLEQLPADLVMLALQPFRIVEAFAQLACAVLSDILRDLETLLMHLSPRYRLQWLNYVRQSLSISFGSLHPLVEIIS